MNILFSNYFQNVIFNFLIKSKLKNTLLLKNKTVSLVGNGPSLLGKKKGNDIDSSDIVIRMNNFKTKGFETDVGAELDVFLTNGWSDVILPEVSDFVEVWFSRRIGGSFLSTRRAYEFLSGKLCSQVESQFLEEFEKEYGVLPSTGLCGLDMLLGRDPSMIKIFGFGHFENNDLHYFEKVGVEHVTHIPDAEREFFDKFLEVARQKGIQVEVYK